MRIHSDTLTESDFHDAMRAAAVGIYRLNRHGSKSRHHAFDVIFTGSGGRYGGGWGNTDYVSATWDEWGIALGVLFARDPAMTAPSAYVDVDHFHWATGHRFEQPCGVTAAGQHRRHRWEAGAFDATHAYRVDECRCGALRRTLFRMTWADFAPAAF